MDAEIISVGTEILTGSILNTNSQYLAKELSNLGVNVHFITTVGDNPERLKTSFNQAYSCNDIILITGGLGPTEDDLTKEVVADSLGLELKLNSEEKNRIINWFKNRDFPLTDNNFKQALIPETATILENKTGTASGIYINKDGKHIFLIPGPPGEMKHVFDTSVVDIINNLNNQKVITNYYNLTGIGESEAEDRIFDLIDNQTNPTLATYAKRGEVLLRVTANGPDAQQKLDEMDRKIKDKLEDNIFSYSDQTLAKVVGNYLIDHNLTISTAESCTGGMIGSMLTDIPGISSSYLLGLITYSNEAKIKVLNVNPETLEKFGAVSEETCYEMCNNVRKILNTNIGVATTGIAGPDGGTKEKPVGLVYTGIATKDFTMIKKNLFQGTRENIRYRSANMVFQMIREKFFKTY